MVRALSPAYKNILLMCLFQIKYLRMQDKRNVVSDLINTILEVPCYLTVRFAMFYCLLFSRLIFQI